MASSIDGESMELEVKHKDNGSWHPCRVSLSSSDSKFGIIVNFENSNEEDIISNREDALARLRFRSAPLQGGECSHIKEGDRVLAMYKDQFRSMFFDAVIEEPYRVQHSNRVFCRCTFEIKWLNPELKEETVTIPSKSIMKLSGEEIGKHPIFAAFLDALSPKDGVKSPSPSSPSLVEETDSETDLQGILEKQIEEISKLVDGSLESSADFLEAKKVKLGGRKHSKAVVTSTVASNNSQNNFRRSTRSQHKEQTEVELKKEPEEDKPFLSPLAARAAFASLLHGHELPLKQELSFYHAGREDQHSLVKNDSKKHIKMHSHNVTYENMECASSKNIMPDLSNSIQDEDDGAHVKSRGTSRCAKQKGTQKNTKPKESPYTEKPQEATKESKGEKSSIIVNEAIDTAKVGKLSGRTMTTRVTRSSMSKEIEVLSGGVKEGSSDGKLTSPVNTTRKTRFSVHKELEASLDETKQESSVEKLTSPMHTTRLTQSRNQKELSNQGVNQELRKTDLIQDTNGISEESEGKKGSSPTIINNSIDLTRGEKLSGQSIVTRVTRSSVHKQLGASSDEEKPGSSSKKLTCQTVRLTRSRIQKEQSDAGVDEDLSENIDDIYKDITPRKSQSNKKRSISSPSDPSIQPSQETNKRTRASHCSTVATEDSSAILEDSKNASVDKKKDEKRKAISSKQPVLRSSPRLNFLSKTRSQNKTQADR